MRREGWGGGGGVNSSSNSSSSSSSFIDKGGGGVKNPLKLYDVIYGLYPLHYFKIEMGIAKIETGAMTISSILTDIRLTDPGPRQWPL